MHLTGVIVRAHQAAGNDPGIADIQGILGQKTAVWPIVPRHIGPGQTALLHRSRPDSEIRFFPGKTVKGLDAIPRGINIGLGRAQVRIHFQAIRVAQTGLTQKFRVRSDADADNDQVGGNFGAVRQIPRS